MPHDAPRLVFTKSLVACAYQTSGKGSTNAHLFCAQRGRQITVVRYLFVSTLFGFDLEMGSFQLEVARRCDTTSTLGGHSGNAPITYKSDSVLRSLSLLGNGPYFLAAENFKQKSVRGFAYIVRSGGGIMQRYAALVLMTSARSVPPIQVVNPNTPVRHTESVRVCSQEAPAGASPPHLLLFPFSWIWMSRRAVDLW